MALEKEPVRMKKAWTETISLDSNSLENWYKQELPIIPLLPRMQSGRTLLLELGNIRLVNRQKKKLVFANEKTDS